MGAPGVKNWPALPLPIAPRNARWISRTTLGFPLMLPCMVVGRQIVGHEIGWLLAMQRMTRGVDAGRRPHRVEGVCGKRLVLNEDLGDLLLELIFRVRCRRTVAPLPCSDTVNNEPKFLRYLSMFDHA